MKAVCILVCLVACTLAATTKRPDTCKHDTDCPDDQCCVHNPLSHRRRRFIFDEFFQHDHGHCRPARAINEACNPFGHDFLNPELHEFHCACETGLECRGETVHESQGQIQHINPKCQPAEA